MTDKKLSNEQLRNMTIVVDDPFGTQGITLEMFQFGSGLSVLKMKREGVTNRWTDDVFQADLSTVEDIVGALEGDRKNEVVSIMVGENYLYVK